MSTPKSAFEWVGAHDKSAIQTDITDAKQFLEHAEAVTAGSRVLCLAIKLSSIVDTLL